jgi:hypothetical protein
VRHHQLPILVLLLAACGGGAASGPAPSLSATTPEGAVRLFFQAVADSNVAAMARLWGSAGGPAIETHKPPDYAKRMEITQLWLRNSPYRVTSTGAVPGESAKRQVQVELDRADIDGKRCVRSISVVVVNAGKDGWIVEAIDLNQAGTPGRSCTGGAVPAEG